MSPPLPETHVPSFILKAWLTQIKEQILDKPFTSERSALVDWIDYLLNQIKGGQ